MDILLPGLSRVAVCGGTHGNELSGVYLVREMLRMEKGDKDMSTQKLLSNPRAVKLCRRYLDVDLNRCFTHAALNGPLPNPAPYEIVRARELNAMLGPKGSPQAVDLVCDLHNTTSNMGLCLIAFSDCDWISLHIYLYLQREMGCIPVRYVHFDVSDKDSYSLDSVGKHGFALEIGPQPHGLVRSNIYSAMKEGLQHILNWALFLMADRWMCSPRLDTWTIQEMRTLTTSQQPFILNSRTETSASFIRETPSSRRSQAKL
ncbi:N-acyl-aromatic-L-amino acid amidohydrolase (carboxylate-forming) B-like isoform X3 [Nerophis ophidion]|uniref:N-acyl-aromatic-L-amino acid amidohydrolase (carboxylate-forming) B-like isoform X3 n=1 Tax=Nerophis ophidion TaxID=159077 RepID=UPI002AE018F4|nr:N-acyl-aromatic-L-amino acid amidohydrolase (carboxylate-forming) B-like isoform X3 [Nerophis ophidion]